MIGADGTIREASRAINALAKMSEFKVRAKGAKDGKDLKNDGMESSSLEEAALGRIHRSAAQSSISIKNEPVRDSYWNARHRNDEHERWTSAESARRG